MTTKEDKEAFIEEIAAAGLQLTPSAQKFFDELRGSEGLPQQVTEKGAAILEFFNSHPIGSYTANEIGKALQLSGRMVSGSIRKLVTDGFVNKEGKNPVLYSLAERS